MIQKKLDSGLEYILKHNLYKKMDKSAVIESDITKLFYPYPYRTNIIEILSIVKREGYLLVRCPNYFGEEKKI